MTSQTGPRKYILASAGTQGPRSQMFQGIYVKLNK